ncbi:MAG: heat shock protein Hsp20 [Pedosphaera sp.]|nr:heat shock protein Hsp20 [Pedosphaera sp.]
MSDTTQTQTQNRPARIGTQAEGRTFVTPPANISANEKEYLIEVEMPGVSKDGMEVTVEGNQLTIIGRRKTEMPEGELLYSEEVFGDYRRVFELGVDVDTSKIAAEMDNGVLKLHIPKSEQAKPRRIPVGD